MQTTVKRFYVKYGNLYVADLNPMGQKIMLTASYNDKTLFKTADEATSLMRACAVVGFEVIPVWLVTVTHELAYDPNANSTITTQ